MRIVIAPNIFVRDFWAASAIASHPIPAPATRALTLYQKLLRIKTRAPSQSSTVTTRVINFMIEAFEDFCLLDF